jgi:Rab9 effector protein with kelch motifs
VTPLQGSHPPPRRAHTAILHDQRVYIFGGGTGIQALGDLWSLDVSQPKETWEWVCLKRNPVPLRPPPSAKSKDGPILQSNSTCAEHYRWSKIMGQADNVPGPNPPPRGYHSANLVNDSMVVIGGSDGGMCFNDIWILDLSAFLHLHFATASPSALIRFSILRSFL